MKKRCYACLAEKPLDDFYKHKLVSDGHVNKCKECVKLSVKKYRAENPEKLRAYEALREKRPERIAKKTDRLKMWRARHPERENAKAKLLRAVYAGKVKPQLCWVCGEKAEAHHPDYSRPLDVVWLCDTHHMQTHALVRQTENTERTS